MVLITISGSRGAGKETILRALESYFDNKIYRIIPCTTRAIREGETPGKELFFLTTEEFNTLEKIGDLVYVTPQIDGKYRSGTLKSELLKSKVSMIDITSGGAKILRNKVEEMGGKVLSLLIYADSSQRFERIKLRQPDLKPEEINSMIVNDPTNPYPENHPDFFVKIKNPDGELNETTKKVVDIVYGYLEEIFILM